MILYKLNGLKCLIREFEHFCTAWFAYKFWNMKYSVLKLAGYPSFIATITPRVKFHPVRPINIYNINHRYTWTLLFPPSLSPTGKRPLGRVRSVGYLYIARKQGRLGRTELVPPPQLLVTAHSVYALWFTVAASFLSWCAVLELSALPSFYFMRITVSGLALHYGLVV